MKLLKISLICSIIFLLVILIAPLKSVDKADAAGRFNLKGTVDKSSYTVGAQIAATFTASFTGSSPTSSQRLKFTGKLVSQTVANNTENTIYDRTFVGNSTWPMSGTYYFTAPATSEGTYYIEFKAYDMNLNQMVETVYSSLPASTSTPKPNPVVTVKANGSNPLTVDSGTKVYITWDVTNNPTSCTCTYNNGNNGCGSGTDYAGSGTKSAAGNPYTMTTTTTFNVTCTN